MLRRRPYLRLSETQQWVFVVIGLALALAWLLGRDACTRTISNTYGTLTQPAAKDGGSPTRAVSSPGRRDAAPDPDW